MSSSKIPLLLRALKRQQTGAPHAAQFAALSCLLILLVTPSYVTASCAAWFSVWPGEPQACGSANLNPDPDPNPNPEACGAPGGKEPSGRAHPQASPSRHYLHRCAPPQMSLGLRGLGSRGGGMGAWPWVKACEVRVQVAMGEGM